MRFSELIQKRFPHIKFRKRARKRNKLDIIKKFVLERDTSVIHRNVLSSFPNDVGLWTKILKFCPFSYQTNAGRRVKRKLKLDIEHDPSTNEIKNKIGNKNIEIFILYKLVNKKTKRDIDNYNKNLIDCLKERLFNDDKQIKFLASKVDYIPVRSKKYSRTLEKAIVRIDFLGKSKVYYEFDRLFFNKKVF